MDYKPDPDGFRCPAEVIALYMRIAWLEAGNQKWFVKLGAVVGKYSFYVGRLYETEVLRPEHFLRDVDLYAWAEEVERAQSRCTYCDRVVDNAEHELVWRNMELICLDCAKERVET